MLDFVLATVKIAVICNSEGQYWSTLIEMFKANSICDLLPNTLHLIRALGFKWHWVIKINSPSRPRNGLFLFNNSNSLNFLRLYLSLKVSRPCDISHYYKNLALHKNISRSLLDQPPGPSSSSICYQSGQPHSQGSLLVSQQEAFRGSHDAVKADSHWPHNFHELGPFF